MEELTVINILDENFFYLGDFVIGYSGESMPTLFTYDRVGNGYYQAQYQGASADPETGEVTGGSWVEMGGPSRDDVIAAADWQKTTALSEASYRIAPLQDAVDTGMATAEEESGLQLWKKYRVLLNRIDTEDAPNITWPVKPE